MKGNWLNLSDEDIKTIVKGPAETLQELVKRQNEESYQLGKKHGAIAELEKIKAEISITNGCGDFIATNDVETLIDKHISELEGENK